MRLANLSAVSALPIWFVWGEFVCISVFTTTCVQLTLWLITSGNRESALQMSVFDFLTVYSPGGLRLYVIAHIDHSCAASLVPFVASRSEALVDVLMRMVDSQVGVNCLVDLRIQCGLRYIGSTLSMRPANRLAFSR
jgi:hypothetical protein